MELKQNDFVTQTFIMNRIYTTKVSENLALRSK